MSSPSAVETVSVRVRVRVRVSVMVRASGVETVRD